MIFITFLFSTMALTSDAGFQFTYKPTAEIEYSVRTPSSTQLATIRYAACQSKNDELMITITQGRDRSCLNSLFSFGCQDSEKKYMIRRDGTVLGKDTNFTLKVLFIQMLTGYGKVLSQYHPVLFTPIVFPSSAITVDQIIKREYIEHDHGKQTKYASILQVQDISSKKIAVIEFYGLINDESVIRFIGRFDIGIGCWVFWEIYRTDGKKWDLVRKITMQCHPSDAMDYIPRNL